MLWSQMLLRQTTCAGEGVGSQRGAVVALQPADWNSASAMRCVRIQKPDSHIYAGVEIRRQPTRGREVRPADMDA